MAAFAASEQSLSKSSASSRENEFKTMDNLAFESPVVVDVGSHTMKAGLSINFPSDREPSVVREVFFPLLFSSLADIDVDGGACAQP